MTVQWQKNKMPCLQLLVTGIENHSPWATIIHILSAQGILNYRGFIVMCSEIYVSVKLLRNLKQILLFRDYGLFSEVLHLKLMYLSISGLDYLSVLK